MRRLAISLALSLSLATNVTAQTVATKPTKLALAQQIVEANGGREATEARINMAYEAMGKAMDSAFAASKSPQLGPLMAKVQKDFQTQLIAEVPQLLDISAEAYADNLTEGELRKMLEWSTSETGRAIRQKMPAVNKDVVGKTMPLLIAMMPTMMQKAIDHACEETRCTAEQRATIAQITNQATAKPAL